MASEPTSIVRDRGKTSWTSTAFMVEAIALLFFLVASVAVFTQLFASAANDSNQASRLASATVVAQNVAEEFSANPAAVAKGEEVGLGIAKEGTSKFQVKCKVTKKKQSSGILYTAHITVSDDQGAAYSLDADRFVEGGK